MAVAMAVTCGFSFAQSADEALRYSELRFGGTARGMGVAGAFGAIGADYSSAISNPGGLALFRKSEAMFSLNLDQIKNNSSYEDSRAYDDRFNFSMPNLGVVFSRKIKNDNHWNFVNFGLGYNRLANFHANSFYKSNATDNSLLKGYANELTGTAANELSYSGNYSIESVLAYDAWLVNAQTGDNTKYYTVADNTDVNQQISIEKRGAIDELSVAVAANYHDKVYFGGYLGIPLLFYRERIRHSEQNPASDNEYFNSFELSQRLNTSGLGVNFKMGVICRPIDWLRLGAAFHTPTYYGIADDYSSAITASFDSLPDPNLQFPIAAQGEFDYNLVTPARVVGSIGLVARKFAFFSFDYEWVDYSNARYKMKSPYSEFEMSVNDDIRHHFAPANVYRAGAELALNKFRLRGGFAHYDSPYQHTADMGDFDASVNYYTFGAGVRLSRVYIDFAYVRSHSKAVNLTVNDVPAFDKITGNKFMVTTGIRF